MNELDRQLTGQYHVPGLGDRILERLRREGKDTERLTRDDIATFDEFHIGGREETRTLARLAELRPEQRVLDIGCGVGGPARTIAAEFGCLVTGLDLVPSYCDAARMLTARVGLADRVTFIDGSATDLPFDDRSFDVVLLQFVGMNISDKSRLYREIHRVLVAGGRLIIHEVLAGNGNALSYPLFWADSPSLSFLLSSDDLKQLLADAGFTETRWDDLSAVSVRWFQEMAACIKDHGPSPLGLGVIIPENAGKKSINLARNLIDGRITILRALVDKNS